MNMHVNQLQAYDFFVFYQICFINLFDQRLIIPVTIPTEIMHFE
jgi:hypothetical protein